jgi:hypothetical protein
MEKPDEKISQIIKDAEVLAEFINIYCSDRHVSADKGPVKAGGSVGTYLERCDFLLCGECRTLLLHAVSKRAICPCEPKPSCKKCVTHCYAPGYRETIREVMRYSGMRLIKKGRLDLIRKYFS